MNKNSLQNFSLILLLLAFITSCDEKGASSSKGDGQKSNQRIDVDVDSTEESGNDLEVTTSNFSDSDEQLVCLWPKVGLRDIAGRKGAKYLTTIYYGETVKYIGETEKASDNKQYVKVELSDGTQGWVYDHLFAKGKLAVLKKSLAIYKRPDIIDFVGNKFNRGDLVVVLDESKGDWKKISGFQKKDDGWIQKSDDFIYDNLDIKLAILYNRAIKEESQSKKQKKLKLIVDNPAFQQSSLIDIVQSSLEGADEEEEDFSTLDQQISSNQLYITTERLNARSNPNSEEDNVVFQLEKGNICNIVEKGLYETIKDKSSNWYKIEFNGNEGWVFGYYTSKN